MFISLSKSVSKFLSLLKDRYLYSKMKPGLFLHSPHVPGLRLPSPAELWGTRHRNSKWAGTFASPPVWAKNGHGVLPKLQSDSQSGTEWRWKFSALVMIVTGINKIWCWAQYQTMLYWKLLCFQHGLPSGTAQCAWGEKIPVPAHFHHVRTLGLRNTKSSPLAPG